jgi:hypothetical protein
MRISQNQYAAGKKGKKAARASRSDESKLGIKRMYLFVIEQLHGMSAINTAIMKESPVVLGRNIQVSFFYLQGTTAGC